VPVSLTNSLEQARETLVIWSKLLNKKNRFRRSCVHCSQIIGNCIIRCRRCER
jgi:hypothetical protein